MSDTGQLSEKAEDRPVLLRISRSSGEGDCSEIVVGQSALEVVRYLVLLILVVVLLLGGAVPGQLLQFLSRAWP